MGKRSFEKTSFTKTWINNENIIKYDSMVCTPPPLKHDLIDYNTWQGFDNEKKPLPPNLMLKLMNISLDSKNIFQIL